ncbi:MAG: phosphatase PAP2 family protein [Actinomycetes bacterium]
MTTPDETEQLPAEGLIDAAVEKLAADHPGLHLPHHEHEPPHEMGVIDRFDHRINELFDRLRGTEPTDRIIYALTELGDFGLIWVLLAFVRGLRSEEDARAAWRLTAVLAAESVIINGLVKTQFKRERPVIQEPRPHRLRIPLSTSFPSGHSSTAMVAGVLLAQKSSTPTKVALFGLGGLVAVSRIHVRIHHASDVAGGLAVGLGLGAIARTVVPLYRRRR